MLNFPRIIPPLTPQARLRRWSSCARDLKARVSFISQQAEFTPPVIYSVGNREKLVFKVEARGDGGLPLRPGLPVTVTPAAEQ